MRDIPWPAGIALPDDPAYLAEVQDLLQSPTVREMQYYPQHGTTSCLEHCLAVSYFSYRTCRRLGYNARAAARAGLLHDMFLYDWHTYRPAKGELLHGFTHARRALENAERAFSLTALERDIILHHMWPLTLLPPRHKESYIVLLHDKSCSLRETLRLPYRKPLSLPAPRTGAYP